MKPVKKKIEGGVASPEILGALLVYATRYAIERHTYASGEVAGYIKVYAPYVPVPDRVTLVKDIQNAQQAHKVDEMSTVQWDEALEALTSPKTLLEEEEV